MLKKIANRLAKNKAEKKGFIVLKLSMMPDGSFAHCMIN